jgi:glycosyltransferase involved in cell wall biosynthesis
MAAAIRESGMDALLIVSGAPDRQEKENHPYQTYLESLPAMMQLEGHACFLSAVFQDPLVAWQQAFRVADVLLFPSGYEGFGLPVVESLYHKLPCWTSLDAASLGLPAAHIAPVDNPQEASARAQGMHHDPVHRERRQWMRDQAPGALYQNHYLPLFQKLGFNTERRPPA